MTKPVDISLPDLEVARITETLASAAAIKMTPIQGAIADVEAKLNAIARGASYPKDIGTVAAGAGSVVGSAVDRAARGSLADAIASGAGSVMGSAVDRAARGGLTDTLMKDNLGKDSLYAADERMRRELQLMAAAGSSRLTIGEFGEAARSLADLKATSIAEDRLTLSGMMKDLEASTSMYGDRFDQLFSKAETTPINVPRLHIPENPVHKTNTLLEELRTDISDMRDFAADTGKIQLQQAEVINGIMNVIDKQVAAADKSGKVNMAISVAGLLVAMVALLITVAQVLGYVS